MYATLPQEIHKRAMKKQTNSELSSNHFPSRICANDAHHILIQFSLAISLDCDRDHLSNNKFPQNIFNFLDKTSLRFFATLYEGAISNYTFATDIYGCVVSVMQLFCVAMHWELLQS